MARTPKSLEVRYETAEAFRRDYRTNLANGGVFVATHRAFHLRDIVAVRLVADFAPECVVELEAEVVHLVPREMADVGGTAGVAVQFRDSPVAVRDRLAPLLAAAGPAAEAPEAPTVPDARRAARKPVRITARIDGDDGMVAGQTRDLSHGGVLVGVEQDSASLGDPVRVALRHPTTGEEIEVDGRVVRELERAGRVSAVAVEFTPPPQERAALERFVDAVQSAEHARRLGGITGSIAELGPRSLVQMFTTTAPVGTLVLRNGPEEGTLCFRAGLLRLARLGPVTGMKALVRMLSWNQGSFEFHARIEPHEESSDAPIPLEGAILDAVRQIDEGSTGDPSHFPPEARLAALPGGGDEPSLSKVEAALLDLARAGFTVHRALDVIPEPDPEIYRALRSLSDHGLIELR